MAFKKMDTDISFADLALVSSLKHNRNLQLMQNLNASIDWSRIEAILMNNYTAGTSTEGTKANPSLWLFKCLLLQKSFRPREIGFAFHRAGINSDPELENQIYPVK